MTATGCLVVESGALVDAAKPDAASVPPKLGSLTFAKLLAVEIAAKRIVTHAAAAVQD